MPKQPEWRPSETFVVKVYRREGGAITGVVEHLRSGERQGFDDLAAMTALIAEMIDDVREPPS